MYFNGDVLHTILILTYFFINYEWKFKFSFFFLIVKQSFIQIKFNSFFLVSDTYMFCNKCKKIIVMWSLEKCNYVLKKRWMRKNLSRKCDLLCIKHIVSIFKIYAQINWLNLCNQVFLLVVYMSYINWKLDYLFSKVL